MANHNEFRKISTTHQSNTIVYSDENGYISDWLDNDPVIQALKGSNEFIGTVQTAPAPDTQSILTQFVVDTVGRQPRSGDEVAIEDVSELWLFNGTSWVFFTTTMLNDATTTSKGVMQVGTGLNVNSGIVSVDSSIYTPSRTIITNTSATPSLALQANTDYNFTTTLTSLTLTSIPNSQYFTTLTFTTGTGFTFTASGLTEYFFLDNPPTFIEGKKYELVITNGKCHVNYIGAREYPINKKTYLNGSLTPDSNNIVTWTVTHNLGTKDIFIRMYETATGETVEIDSKTSTLSQVEVKFYSESALSTGKYTLVVIG